MKCGVNPFRNACKGTNKLALYIYSNKSLEATKLHCSLNAFVTSPHFTPPWTLLDALAIAFSPASLLAFLHQFNH